MFPSCYVARSPATTVARGRYRVDRAGGSARLVRDAPLNKKSHGAIGMSVIPTAWRRVLCLGVIVGTLSACGGGGGGGSDPAPSSSGAAATGLWEGTFASSDGTSRGFGLVIWRPTAGSPASSLAAGSNGRFVLGTGDTPAEHVQRDRHGVRAGGRGATAERPIQRSAEGLERNGRRAHLTHRHILGRRRIRVVRADLSGHHVARRLAAGRRGRLLPVIRCSLATSAPPR